MSFKECGTLRLGVNASVKDNKGLIVCQAGMRSALQPVKKTINQTHSNFQIPDKQFFPSHSTFQRPLHDFTLKLDLIFRTVNQYGADSVQIVVVAAPKGPGPGFCHLQGDL